MSSYTWPPPATAVGGGIASINGDNTSAQLIVGGSGIAVSSTGGTTTISATPVVDVWTKYTFTHTDFATAATTNTITLASAAAKTVVHQIILKPSIHFAGGGLGSYTIQMIDDAGYLYSTPFPVNVAPSDTQYESDSVDHVVKFSGGVTYQLVATCDVNLDTSSVLP